MNETSVSAANSATEQEESPKLWVRATVETKAFKAFASEIAALSDEAKVVADSDGFTVAAVDPAHIAMIRVELPKERFRELKVKPRPATFALDFDKVAGFLRTVTGDTLEIDLEGTRLTFRTRTQKRTMPLVDDKGMGNLKMPKLDDKLPTAFEVSLADLRRVVGGCAQISDHLAIFVDRARVQFLAEGDTDTYCESFSREDLAFLKATKEQVRSLFPLDYFTSMVKALYGVAAVRIRIGQDYPLTMAWEAPTKGIYALAPRIEADDGYPEYRSVTKTEAPAPTPAVASEVSPAAALDDLHIANLRNCEYEGCTVELPKNQMLQTPAGEWYCPTHWEAPAAPEEPRVE